MRFFIILLFPAALLAQGTVSPIDLWRMDQETRDRTMREAQTRDDLYQKRLFEERFNSLVQALARFGEVYNRTNGQVLPYDKLTAIKKAWRDLERTQTFSEKR